MNTTVEDIKKTMEASSPAGEKEIAEFVSGIMQANTTQMMSYLFGIVTVIRIVYSLITSGKYKDIDKKSISASIDGVDINIFPVIKIK